MLHRIDPSGGSSCSSQPASPVQMCFYLLLRAPLARAQLAESTPKGVVVDATGSAVQRACISLPISLRLIANWVSKLITLPVTQ